MKARSILYFSSALLLAGASFWLSGFNTASPRTHSKLVWSDEFDYKGLPDSSKWTYDVGGHGWGNNEMQYYTAGRLENARVENGKLIIEARKENWEGKEYTSARLVTKGKGDWQYGRIEVRAKLPKGLGTWPAIWMLGSDTAYKWPDDGEIDIMEHVGYNQGMIYGSVHTQKYHHVINTQKTDSVRVADCSEKFHVYGVDWTADSVHISVDFKNYFSFGNEQSGKEAWPFDSKMHLLLNIAVGGDWGGARGLDEKAFPALMEVDYVRIYQ
ncbi:MAG: glycoside hydrolase family 16 protein [Candidatus Pseudobacter hemicellulosilyticus]|uniref:Glycoside hydrolase family 16 protein n=1 Tax=Candidatus Pseudobacter hemicellulosilyticus TaxID=3121375 RepID=A0AAJ5WNE7_9BACT|nr:MAG: glycoside hydrolase family 16 protein [Pseudobacter sp.]